MRQSMIVRLLCSLGVAIAAGVVTIVVAVGVDMLARPNPVPGSFGLIGFEVGLLLSPITGIGTAVVVFLVMRRRARRSEATRAEAGSTPTHREL